jgi:hypothetical protein
MKQAEIHPVQQGAIRLDLPQNTSNPRVFEQDQGVGPFDRGYFLTNFA